MSDFLKAEINTYNANLETLLSQVGKYVLIKGNEIVDYFEAYEDALKAGYTKFDDDVFLVKRIAAAEQVSYFTRSLTFGCPA